jgi:hypothetical protein
VSPTLVRAEQAVRDCGSGQRAIAAQRGAQCGVEAAGAGACVVCILCLCMHPARITLCTLVPRLIDGLDRRTRCRTATHAHAARNASAARRAGAGAVCLRVCLGVSMSAYQCRRFAYPSQVKRHCWRPSMRTCTCWIRTWCARI